AVALGPGLGHDDRALVPGVGRDPAGRLGERVAHDLRAGRLVAFQVELVECALSADQRDAAARVADTASSMRCFFSLSSTSVAAPTLITDTPPDSFASRSCSFSLSQEE